MADVAVRSVASAGSETVSAPAGVASGDLLIAVVGTSGQGARGASASGWTLQGANPGSPALSHAVLWKVATASEPSSYTFTGAGTFGVTVAALTGADTSAPFDAAPAFDSGSQGPFTAPSVDIATTGSLLICAFGILYHAPELPAGMTALGDGFTLSYTKYFAPFSQAGMQPGATGARQAGDAFASWEAVAFAIKPGGSTPPPEEKSGAVTVELPLGLDLSATKDTGGGSQDLRKNWSTNPALAVDGTGWNVDTTGGTPELATNLTGFSRSTGLHYTRGSTTGSPKILPPFIEGSAIAAGQTWATYLELSGTSGQQATVWFNFYDASGSYLNPNPSQTVDLSPTPTQVSFPGVVAPDGVAKMAPSIEYNMAAGEELWVTCADSERADAIPSYGDGDTSGWVWDGTPGLSTSHQTQSQGETHSGSLTLEIPLDLAVEASRGVSTAIEAGWTPEAVTEASRAVSEGVTAVGSLHTLVTASGERSESLETRFSVSDEIAVSRAQSTDVTEQIGISVQQSRSVGTSGALTADFPLSTDTSATKHVAAELEANLGLGVETTASGIRQGALADSLELSTELMSVSGDYGAITAALPLDVNTTATRTVTAEVEVPVELGTGLTADRHAGESIELSLPLTVGLFGSRVTRRDIRLDASMVLGWSVSEPQDGWSTDIPVRNDIAATPPAQSGWHVGSVYIRK